MTVLLVLLGGAIGAPARYLGDRFVQSRHRVAFPFGTLLINVSGSLLLGVVAGGVAKSGWSPHLQTLVGTGFCGGLTTFSTFSVEAVQLLSGRMTVRALTYVLGSAALGIAAAALGWTLA